MYDQTYTTPEGFTLHRPLLLPDVRDFAELLTYVREWDFNTMSGHNGEPPAAGLVPLPSRIGDNELGPFCTIDLGQLGGPKHRSIAVTVRSRVLEVIAPRIVTDDDRLSFKVIGHKGTGRALVIADHNYILGSHYLAYIDPATIPAAGA